MDVIVSAGPSKTHLVENSRRALSGSTKKHFAALKEQREGKNDWRQGEQPHAHGCHPRVWMATWTPMESYMKQ